MNIQDGGHAFVVYYEWLGVGDIYVYVADIKDDADEKAIRDQIYARGMDWAWRSPDAAWAMNDLFDIKPKHWYTYLNPFWWRRRKLIKAVLNYQWEKYGKEQFEIAYRNTMLYGSSLPPEAWKTEEDDPPDGDLK